MPVIKPSPKRYDPSTQLNVEGQFFARCTDVRDGIPNRTFPDRKPLIAIEFTLSDHNYPHLIGKVVSALMGESIYRDPTTKKESKLLVFSRMMGSKEPERGINTDDWIGRWYFVRVEAEDGRCFVRAVMPAPTPTSAVDTPKMGIVPQIPQMSEQDEPHEPEVPF